MSARIRRREPFRARLLAAGSRRARDSHRLGSRQVIRPIQNCRRSHSVHGPAHRFGGSASTACVPGSREPGPEQPIRLISTRNRVRRKLLRRPSAAAARLDGKVPEHSRCQLTSRIGTRQGSARRGNNDIVVWSRANSRGPSTAVDANPSVCSNRAIQSAAVLNHLRLECDEHDLSFPSSRYVFSFSC